MMSVSENLAVDFDHNFDGEKIKLFRPGVLSRVWYLGPCDDLSMSMSMQMSMQGAVLIWPLGGRYDAQERR
jgi:hypothetical protein